MFLFLDPSVVIVLVFFRSIDKMFYLGGKLFGLSVIILHAKSIHWGVRWQKADSKEGMKALWAMKWWGGKKKESLFFALSSYINGFLRPHPTNILEKWLLQTTPFPSAFVHIMNYFKAWSF